jgi:hypothetical protein
VGIVWCIHHRLDYVFAERVTDELLQSGIPAQRVTLDEYRATIGTARGTLEQRDVSAAVFFLSPICIKELLSILPALHFSSPGSQLLFCSVTDLPGTVWDGWADSLTPFEKILDLHTNYRKGVLELLTRLRSLLGLHLSSPTDKERTVELIKIYISSPDDVEEERRTVENVIEHLRCDPFIECSLATVNYVRQGLVTVDQHPQSHMNVLFGRPDECDLVIVILWSKLGTAIASGVSGRQGELTGTQWEFETAITSAERRGAPWVVAYHREDPVLIPVNDPNYESRRFEYGLVVRFLETDIVGRNLPHGSFVSYKGIEDFRNSIETTLRKSIKGLLKDRSRSLDDSRALARLSWTGCPFPGLRPFLESERAIFFGREHESDDIIRRLWWNGDSFVAVVGSSGSGKSSLIKAGVIPHLRRLSANSASKLEIYSLRPSEFTREALSALQEHLAAEIDSATNDMQKMSQAARPFAEERILLFIDQFEELFTVCGPELRQDIFKLIIQSVALPRVQVVCTLRSDFYDDTIEVAEFASLLKTGTYPLASPNIGALFRMLTYPAVAAGVSFEDGLAETIIADTGSGSGALALMAFAVEELYRTNRPGYPLSHEQYDAIGRVKGALAKRADIAVEHIPDPQGIAFSSVFKCLVNVDEQGSASRRGAERDELNSSDEARALVEALIGARLLVGRGGGTSRHESKLLTKHC